MTDQRCLSLIISGSIGDVRWLCTLDTLLGISLCTAGTVFQTPKRP